MLFSTAGNCQAVEIPFNWNADYANGKNVTEYDLFNHKKRDFYMIDRNQVIRFGLFGHNMKFFFEMYDGSFNLRGHRIEMEYHTNDGEILHLTSNFENKDIITYKEAFTDLSNTQGVQRSNLKSINFGYKTFYKKDDIEIFFKPVVSLPVYESPYIEVKITSNKDLNGYLVVKGRGEEIQKIEMPITVGKGTQVNWTIK